MNVNRVALIGFGEVGQALATDLAAANDIAITAFDLKFSDAGSSPSRAVRRSGACRAETTEDAVRGADVVISAVTAASTIDAAAAASAAINRDAWFFDLNSASPAAKSKAARLIDGAGGRYVEASVMSPINPKRLASPVLLGGPHARDFEPVARAIGFSGARFYSNVPGKTAAAKLCRSVIVKGMEALITESLLAARHYGVEEDVLSSLETLFPHPDWEAHARYMIARTLQHGTRRAEEMREAARTIADSNIDPWMSKATARRQAWAGALAIESRATDLPSLLDAVRSSLAEAETDGLGTSS